MRDFLRSYFHPVDRSVRNVQLACAAANLVLAGWLLSRGVIPFVNLPVAVFHSTLAVIAERNARREHRETEGDRGDHGALTVSFGGASVNTNITYEAVAAALRAAGGTGTLSTRSGLSLPVRASDEPIKAWKRALIVPGSPTPRFRGISGQGGSYSIDDVARCTRSYAYAALGSFGYEHIGSSHELGPVLDCSCGFYAMSNEVKPEGDGILLEVELYGRVIVCERGYRAERQRVLSVTLPSRCASQLCAERAELFTFVDGGGVGLCGEHVALSDHSPLLTPAPLSALAGLLGTEVRWAA